jgi:hypothetical protein
MAHMLWAGYARAVSLEIELNLLQRNARDLTRGWGPYFWLLLYLCESILAVRLGTTEFLVRVISPYLGAVRT